MAHTKVTKTYSQNTGAANTFSYSGSFDVFKGTEVVALLDNVLLTYTASTINESASPREYTVDTSAKTIHIGGADLSSGVIIIRPETDMGAPTPRADYSPGASITSADLNNNQLQLMRKAMEYDEQKLSSTGGTMTGDLTMGEDTNIVFEGATDDAYETTLTVTDPTADRTITIPNVTGTVVTTGDTGSVATAMIAADAITNAKIADNALDSEHYTDGSIDADHLASSSVTTAKIASDAVTGAKIADDAIDSEHYTDGSIDTAHIGDSQVTSAKIADGTIVAGDIASDAVTTAKILDSNVTTAKIAADAITAAKIADDVVNSEHYAAGSIDTEHIADLNVTTAKIAADAITGAKIADDAIDSEHYTDGSIDTAHIGGTQVTAAKIASNAVTTAKITDANVTTAKIADSNVTLAKLASDLKSTSISDSDTQLPTSGAVVDYVAAQIAPIGGLEVIATDAAFPNTQPSSGVVISIADAGGLVVNGSGTSTTGRTVGGSTVTINNIASNFNSSTVDAGVCFQVSSTGSGQIYNYHKATLKEADLLSLSNDINDFAARYRVQSGEPSSNNDAGDLAFDTAASKMKVYDGSSWGEVTSSGDFKYLVMTNAGTTNAATLNGSNVTFDLKETSTGGSAAAVTSAAQLMVSVNGVVQKPNTGTNPSGLDGFVMADSDTITFCAAPASGDDIFIIQTGSAITPTTPADGTVTAAKIGSGAVTTAKIADDAVTGAKIADDAIGAEHIEGLDANVDWDDGVGARFGASNDLQIRHNSSGKSVVYHSHASGVLSIAADHLNLADHGNEHPFITCDRDGAVELYHDNTVRLATNANGIEVNGHVWLGDGEHVKFGAGTNGDLQIYHDGTNSILNNTTGHLDFHVDGTKKMRLSDGGDLQFDDSRKIELGTSQDLQIYHDGSNSYITDSGTGALRINSSDARILNAAGDEDMIRCIENGAVELFHDNGKVFYTQSYGATVKRPSGGNTVLDIIGSEGQDAEINMFSDDGDDDADQWKLAATSNEFFLKTKAGGSYASPVKIIGNTGVVHIDRVGEFTGLTNTVHGVRSTDNNWTQYVVNSHASEPYGLLISFNNSHPDDRTSRFLQCGDDTTGRCIIYSDGDIENHDGSYGTTSDVKLKENIVDANSQWDDIKAVRVRNFNFKISPDKKQIGVVAQELETVCPGLVKDNPDLDKDMNDLGTTTKSVKSSILYMKAIKALQEAMARIETLETKVATLEAK